jgi:amino acid permease
MIAPVLDEEEDLTPLHVDSPESSMPKTASWRTAGLLMIADVVGAGVMGLATAFAQLGWVLSLLSICVWYAANMWVGMLLVEAKEAWPHCESFMELAGAAFGRRARMLTGLAVYSFLGMVLGDYLLIIGETLEMMFYDPTSPGVRCGPIWTTFGAMFLVPLAQIRLLSLTRFLMIVNVITLVGSVVVCLVAITQENTHAKATNSANTTAIVTEAVASNLTIMSFFHSQALFAFAYMGVFIYLEIIAEMREPAEFKYSLLWLSGPFQFCMYLLTGAWGYGIIGSGANGLLIKQMPKGLPYRFAAFLLFVHMLLTFLVKGTILSRAIHSFISPESAKDFSRPEANRVYFSVSLGVVFFTLVIANLIPFFDDLTSLLGAFQTPFIGFLLPIWFAYKARKNLNRVTSSKEFYAIVAITVFMILLFFIGIVTSFVNIVNRWNSYGSPFANCFGK